MALDPAAALRWLVVLQAFTGDLFSLQSGVFQAGSSYSLPKEVWLPSTKGKGLQVEGTFARRQGQLYMDMTLSNRAMSAMAGFAIQFNKNSFGLSPATALPVGAPLGANQSIQVSLPLNTVGPVQRMDPLLNLQVAMKNNIDVFYFNCLLPCFALWTEDGNMDRKVFLATWKDIPNSNEVQTVLNNVALTSDAAEQRLQSNNVFTIARRNIDGQDLLYVSLKFSNGIWVLGELKFAPAGGSVAVALKTQTMDVVVSVQESLDVLLHY